MHHPPKPGGFSSYSFKEACLIIGITSLAIFILNILALALASDANSVQWRVNFLEQVGNRSIALLFGFALIAYGFSDHYKLRKWLAFICLMSGILFQMGCILTIHDTLILQKQAAENITQQANQVKIQIQEGEISVDDSQEAERALQRITIREQELEQRAKSDITRAGIVSVGNLLIPGLGLIGLGRLGLKTR